MKLVGGPVPTAHQPLCDDATCWECNAEQRPRCGPCRRVMAVIDGWGFRCPDCGAGVSFDGWLR